MARAGCPRNLVGCWREACRARASAAGMDCAPCAIWAWFEGCPRGPFLVLGSGVLLSRAAAPVFAQS
eukprot:9336557-Lingulodinium_polyedra.AAC.1